MQPTKQHALIMWILWFAYLQSAFVMQWILGKGIPEGANVEVSMAVWLWVLAFVPLCVATMIRWYGIPRLEKPAQMLVAMLVGLSLSEASIFISLFLIGADYPQNQIAVLVVAVFSLIQFAPSYATPGYKLPSEL